MPIRVLVADDHPLIREGLRIALTREGFAVVAESADGREALSQVLELQPEVAVLDFSMPVLNGLEAAREIMRLSPATRSIILTQHAEESYVQEALQAGVHGYVSKSEGMADLARAIRTVCCGGVYFSSSIPEAVIRAGRQKDPPQDPLTRRERQVLQLIAEGLSARRTAEVLGISVKTAESHRSNIMSKLDIRERAGLVRYAVRRGLVEP